MDNTRIQNLPLKLHLVLFRDIEEYVYSGEKQTLVMMYEKKVMTNLQHKCAL